MHLPFLLNWSVNPYHAPIIVAKQLGFYQKHGIDLNIHQPENPSEVTRIIGEGKIPIGLKAMVHCYAARDRGYPIQSIGTLLDEPPTGLISRAKNPIHSIEDIKGKRLGYIGEFGKIMIDHLAQNAGIPLDAYETVRVGMQSTEAIASQQVDAAMGIACFQQVALESQGMPTALLRIDEAANLGCCCFCSIMIIVHQNLIDHHSEQLQHFMRATHQGMTFTREHPDEAFRILKEAYPQLAQPHNQKIFYHCLPFFSKDCLNVERDWNKVGAYAKTLNILDQKASPQEAYTHAFSPL